MTHTQVNIYLKCLFIAMQMIKRTLQLGMFLLNLAHSLTRAAVTTVYSTQHQRYKRCNSVILVSVLFFLLVLYYSRTIAAIAAIEIPPFLDIFFFTFRLKSDVEKFRYGDFQRSDEALSSRITQLKLKLLCFITTQPSVLTTKAHAVNITWGRRCDKILYVISELGTNHINGHDIIKIDTPNSRDHLTAKSRETFIHIYNKYINDYDWFYKADDDTYAVVENLKYLMSIHSPMDRVLLGHYMKFKTVKGIGYLSGGAGYALSRESLRSLVEDGFYKDICPRDGGSEDLILNNCAVKTGSKVFSSRDRFHRETFHPESTWDIIAGPPGRLAEYYSRYYPTVGPECCSELAISFHRIAPEQMIIYDQLLYRTTVYGQTYDQKKLESLFVKREEDKIPEN